VQLFVCCEKGGSTAHCDKCDATVWLPAAQRGKITAAVLLLASCKQMHHSLAMRILL
jgi:hypothetical protein